MARRASTIEDIMEVASRLPWRIGVVIAIAVFVGLHLVSGLRIPAPIDMSQLGSHASLTLIVTFAGILQYLLPLLILFGAAASFIRQRRGVELLSSATANPVAAVDAMPWQDFERLVGETYRQKGYAVTHTGGGGPDGGVDLVLTQRRERTLVQCKQWRAWKVDVKTVRELYGVMTAKGAARGIVVSAGEFTADALEFAGGRNIDLLNGRELAAILRAPAAAKPDGQVNGSTACPQCGSRMVKRIARKGQNAGQAFWGCATFPACRATVPIVGEAPQNNGGA